MRKRNGITLETELNEGIFSAETTSNHALFSIVGLRPGYQKKTEPAPVQETVEEPTQVVIRQVEPEPVPEVVEEEPQMIEESVPEVEEPVQEQRIPYGTLAASFVLVIAGMVLVFFGVKLWKSK